LSVEPMESLRYVEFLKKDGWIITNSTPFINITNYPEVEEVIKRIKKRKNSIILDADKLAKEVGSPRSSNIVALGAATPFIDIPYEAFEEAIRQIFEKKGERIIDANIAALKAGRAVADAQLA
ncbi:MAG: 2-oxoacid:acceptor oxidoreductase family protein, partial [Bacteroidales bacterium]|nr:2-oxoacid:acceptor oxidoreductase family protein [Bacteroidales bacterium]